MSNPTTSKALTAAELLTMTTRDAPTSLDLPGNRGRVFLRVMTGTERDKFDWWIHNRMQSNAGLEGARALLATLCLCDESGQRLFGDDQVTEVGQMPAPVLQAVFTEAQRINAMDQDEVDTIEGN